MRPPYKAVIGVIILLMIVAPAVSLAKCVEDHFQCCGSYTAATEIGTASELSGCPGMMYYGPANPAQNQSGNATSSSNGQQQSKSTH